MYVTDQHSVVSLKVRRLATLYYASPILLFVSEDSISFCC